MIIEVLGLGKSIENYSKRRFTTIGVNDVYRYHKTDFILMVDPPVRFEPDRKQIILESTPKKFYCNHFWKVPNFEYITLAPVRGCVKKLDSQFYCYSNNSAFTACVLAYKMGAKQIVMHGVDFVDHNALCTPNNFKRALNDFKELSLALEERGVSLCVSSRYSALSDILRCLED